MKEFRAAIEAGDWDKVGDLFAEDIIFRSPVAFKPYVGKPIVHAIIRGVGRVFTDFSYVNEINDGADTALLFETFVNGVSLHGCDFIHVNEAGLIDTFTVMVRPLSASTALSEAMAAQFPQIQAEALTAMTESN